MLNTSPFHRENYSRLILGVVIQFYQRCSDRFQILTSSPHVDVGREPRIALAAQWAQRPELQPCLTELVLIEVHRCFNYLPVIGTNSFRRSEDTQSCSNFTVRKPTWKWNSKERQPLPGKIWSLPRKLFSRWLPYIVVWLVAIIPVLQIFDILYLPSPGSLQGWMLWNLDKMILRRPCYRPQIPTPLQALPQHFLRSHLCLWSRILSGSACLFLAKCPCKNTWFLGSTITYLFADVFKLSWKLMINSPL